MAPKKSLGAAMGTYRVISNLGMVIGPIAVSYAAGGTGSDIIPFTPFIIPAVIAIIAAISIIWAADPAAKRKTQSTIDKSVND